MLICRNDKFSMHDHGSVCTGEALICRVELRTLPCQAGRVIVGGYSLFHYFTVPIADCDTMEAEWGSEGKNAIDMLIREFERRQL